jgi:ABC-type transport system involved in cytochrome c biogenesis ATPase subunit
MLIKVSELGDILIIKRLRVEEGFFHSLDLEFSDGLNVLIGGRGVGKTSIIELLRFGLGVTSLSEVSANESISHAISILQSTGKVIIELEINNELITVSRAANDPSPRSTNKFLTPIIFSQKEIETVSLNSDGKLNLINSFIPINKFNHEKVELLLSEIKSITANHAELKKQYDEIYEKTIGYDSLKQHEKTLSQQQKILLSNDSLVKENEVQLNSLQSVVGAISVDIHNVHSLRQQIETKVNNLKKIQSNIVVPPLQTNEAKALTDKIQNRINQDSYQLTHLINENLNLIAELETVIQSLNTKKLGLEENSRANRTQIDSYKAGSGQILSELGRLRENIAQVENWKSIANGKLLEINEIYEQCQNKLNELSSLRLNVFNERQKIVNDINAKLHPSVVASIGHLTNLQGYSNALELAFKGSGLKYKELTSTIAKKLSPQWLFYYVFTLQYDEFANAIGIPIDRATRLIGYLNDIDLGNVLTASMKDEIHLSLLDRGNYKGIDDLSIGQRCTVALSIILENNNRVLIIDQPEDHLDNEFIVNTLMKSLIDRAANAQTIISSHNANIPVLGNAKKVINLDSNGRSGFIKCAGALDDVMVKKTIESIMEGGKDAFIRRASFYQLINE